MAPRSVPRPAPDAGPGSASSSAGTGARPTAPGAAAAFGARAAASPAAVDHDANVVGALAIALADRIGDATAAAAGVDGVPAAALVALHEWAGGKPIQALADGLRLSHSRTVRVIDRLQADGLALRTRDPADGRSALLDLTPAGREAARRTLAARAGVLERGLVRLGPDSRAALAELAEQVLEELTEGRRAARATCRLCDAHACGHHAGRCPVTRGADAAERAVPA